MLGTFTRHWYEALFVRDIVVRYIIQPLIQAMQPLIQVDAWHFYPTLVRSTIRQRHRRQIHHPTTHPGHAATHPGRCLALLPDIGTKHYSSETSSSDTSS